MIQSVEAMLITYPGLAEAGFDVLETAGLAPPPPPPPGSGGVVGELVGWFVVMLRVLMSYVRRSRLRRPSVTKRLLPHLRIRPPHPQPNLHMLLRSVKPRQEKPRLEKLQQKKLQQLVGDITAFAVLLKKSAMSFILTYPGTEITNIASMILYVIKLLASLLLLTLNISTWSPAAIRLRFTH